MKVKTEKKYLIISEFGQQRRISSQKDLIKNLDISFKDLGLTKNDIILISSNDLDNKTDIILSQNKKDNGNLNEIKEDYYLFSVNNRYEIYKQEFDNKIKAQLENNSFISTKELLGDRLSVNYKNDSYINGNNQQNNNNIQIQREISHVQELYTNFKSICINIDSNFDLIHSLMNKNISNINKSISILYNYYNNRIKTIKTNFETLKENFQVVNTKVVSTENKIKNFTIIKIGINNKEELALFKLLINEKKMKQIRDKIDKNINMLKEKIKNKSKSFEEIIKKQNNNNIENKMKDIIDEKKLEEIKNEFQKVKEKYNIFKTNNNKNKFNSEIKKIIEKNYENINEKNSEISFDIKHRIDRLDDYKKEDELNIIINDIKNIKNYSENLLNKIKIFISDSIIKKFFRFSTDIYSDLDNFESYNNNFISYKNLLETIDKDNFDLFFSLDEALRFRFYSNEYERRINYLKDLKKIIYKLKKSLLKENEIRQKFNDELKKYFSEKVENNMFGTSNSIISFFEWDEIKGSFDIYGDKYYTTIEIEEDELNYFISNNKFNPKISSKSIDFTDDIFSHNYFQHEMIYHLNNKILEYKSEINQLTQKIENKNNEFKQLKYNIDQINNLFNDINKKIQNKIKNNIITTDENSGIKKENKIFNPLYDESNDDINEEESFAIKDNNYSMSSNEDIKNANNINNNENNDTYLTLEQTFIIKKTFFNYFTNLLSMKNEEYNKLFALYNSLKMSLEDKR